MKKFLTIATTVLCAISLYGEEIKLGTGFSQIKLGEKCIPGWIDQYISNPNNGVSSVIKDKEGRLFFNVKSSKEPTSFYCSTKTPAKPGDILVCAVRATGKGKISIGCYAFGTNGRYYPLPRRQRTITVSETGKLYRVFITLSDKGRYPLGTISPEFTVEKDSDINIYTLAFALIPKKEDTANSKK
ncbi:MAG: hypothetical protein IKA22_02470 [Lentisphaeria bacterium]|nr:hypothetical protein [Lentisphaeria bacterium]